MGTTEVGHRQVVAAPSAVVAPKRSRKVASSRARLPRPRIRLGCGHLGLGTWRISMGVVLVCRSSVVCVGGAAVHVVVSLTLHFLAVVHLRSAIAAAHVYTVRRARTAEKEKTKKKEEEET